MFELTPYSSDDEVKRVLTEQRVRLQSSIGGDPYPVDWHYEMFALDSISTLEDALAFCDRLDAECNAHSVTGCTKSRQNASERRLLQIALSRVGHTHAIVSRFASSTGLKNEQYH